MIGCDEDEKSENNNLVGIFFLPEIPLTNAS